MSYLLPSVSLKDIARELDVSISLVSKVLNDKLGNTRVSEELAEKIRKVAKDMNYRKNSSALSLRSGFHNSISVMIHRHGEKGSSLVDYMVRGIFETANQYNQKVLLGYFQQRDEFLEVCESAHRGLVDGVLIGGVPHIDLCDVILEMQRDGLPLVTILEEGLLPEVPNAGIHVEAACSLPTQHLIEQGCKTIGHLAVIEKRTNGYKAAMREAGLAVEDEFLIDCNRFGKFGYESGVQAAGIWLSSGRFPEGVVAQSDSLAAGLMNTLNRAGIRCPDDILITGVDDSPFCGYSLPSLTSVNQRSYPRGILAAEMFMTLREGGTVESKTFEPTLKIRESSGGKNGEDTSGDIPDS